MPTTRSYQDLCGIARALDVVGERWALLIVRELLFGPQRFSELRRVLVTTSSNVIADRLRELEANGVIQRRRLPPPAASWVYELTPWGRQLEPILLALGLWGLRTPLPADPAVISPTTVLLYLRTRARPNPAEPSAVVRIELDGQRWTAETDDGRLEIHAGDIATADGTIRTDPKTLRDLIGAPSQLRKAIRSGAATFDGNQAIVRRLLQQATPTDQLTSNPGCLPAQS
jgi:DNA-binding HxlR family transcriptional regulator